MPDYSQSVNQHYGQDDLSAKILAALQNAGKDINALTRDDLRTFDEFHIGGIAETRNLATLAGLHEGQRVLDVGSGLGGPARTLAAEFGCHVTGIDLTEEFVRAATMLTKRVGLVDKVSFQVASALELPFEDNTFDAVWTQFVGMNIGDKERLYDQFRRALRNGGRLALHEIMGGEGELHYPVLWANDPLISFLRPPEFIYRLLKTRGFHEIMWKDVSLTSFDWFRRMVDRAQQSGPHSLGFDVFISDNLPQKVDNMLRNLQEGRMKVFQTVFKLEK